jgi:hypothetical protein
MSHIWEIIHEIMTLLLESSLFILFGLVVSGLIRIFLNPASISKHLGQGKFLSVFKAALVGIPLPICSCGVLPTAVSLRKQGANTGATTAFLISTPESGVDSIAVSYALLDPILTVARPLVAFISSVLAGVTENLLNKDPINFNLSYDTSCPVDDCCDGKNCSPEEHAAHHTFFEKCTAGFRHAFFDVWYDMAGWFFAGLLFAGIITAFIPDDFASDYLGGGLSSMLIMLAVGIPLYICATASTPMAAALILKGVSPGAALVFLLTGPATNITSLTVLLGVLGKRATAIYLATIAGTSVVSGLLLDRLYVGLDISPAAALGQAGEIIPEALKVAATVLLVILSFKPVSISLKNTVLSIFSKFKFSGKN